MEQIYTVEEAAKILKVSSKTVRTWLQHRKLKGVLAGRFWRVRESDLEAFLREPDAPEETPKPTHKPAAKARAKRQR